MILGGGSKLATAPGTYDSRAGGLATLAFLFCPIWMQHEKNFLNSKTAAAD